jgi:adenylate cyclase
MPPVRRLTAILAADVAGYSRLMGADEEGTHERLKAHLRELIEPKIAEHRGRIVKNTGDGLLAEFQSVVDAVKCAVEVQRGMMERNVAVSPEKRIEFRIGINLGDVIAEEHDIFGDGVNVAARLEALAEPGGICVSRVVRDQVRDRLDYTFEDLGERQVKNITRPVRVYALRPEPTPAHTVAGAVAIPQTPAAPRLSIMVLPFDNMGSDQEQQYFADGISEDLTTDLSRITGMVVISRNTAFSYRNKPIDTRQLGRELNVRYVLEGSVRRSGDRIRINAQLIDAETNTHLWAERFDHYIDDLFVLQDEVTRRIAIALNVELVNAEASRPVDNLDVLDYILRGRAALDNYTKPRRESLAAAVRLFENALAVDPGSVDAKALLATALMARVLDQVTVSVALDMERAEALVEQALAASPRHAVAHFAKAQVSRAQGRYETAIPEYEAAIALNPNWVLALAALGQCKFLAGSIDEAIPAQELAIRLSPRDPRVVNWYWRIGMVHLLKSRTDEAIRWLEKARSTDPEVAGPRAWLASAYALNGEIQRAANELAAARKLSDDNRYSSIAKLNQAAPYAPNIRALAEATYFGGLRKAGMPEE